MYCIKLHEFSDTMLNTSIQLVSTVAYDIRYKDA